MLRIKKHVLKTLLFLQIVLFNFYSFSQEVIFSENIADASGAVDLLNSGSFSVQYTGGYGLEKDLIGFPEFIDVPEKNSLFLRYIAPSKGYLTFKAEMFSGTFQVVLFKNISQNMLSDMKDGSADIAYKNLSFHRSTNDMEKIEPIYLNEGQVVLLMFNSSKKSTSSLELKLTFKDEEGEENIVRKKRIVDARSSFSPLTFTIQIRDAETNAPIISSVNVRQRRGANLYTGSDIIFDNETQTKLVIKCDAPGYFFADTNYTMVPDSSRILTIPMKSVSVGKVLKIDRIEFVKGSADLIPGTESILIRVKDFLVLNSDVNIEIQGHVNNEGKESLSTRKLSAKRGKTIMKYFIKSGINKDRMTVKGYGSDFPIYPTPKNDREQQANRRVEIKIMK